MAFRPRWTFDQWVGLGVVLVVAVIALNWLAGNLTEPQPCIQVPAFAHQDESGYWFAGTIGPYGWSQPGTDRCIVAVP